MKRIIRFVKKETVLTIAWILALISAFIITPSKAYIDYIDFKSLGTLWSLMVIMEGLKRLGVFKVVGLTLLKKTSKVWQLSAVLVGLCFFFSMFITNDVALLTFVPFAIFMLEMCDRLDLLIPIIVLQTIAANLGSMLTPIGNPQNLYLYGLSGMSFIDFVKLMLPYTAVTAILIIANMFLLKGKSESIAIDVSKQEDSTSFLDDAKDKGKLIMYVLLFVLSLLIVGHILPFYVLVVCVLICCLLTDYKSVIKIDYALLLTFVGFFIFTGNLGQIESVKSLFISTVHGHEIIAGVLASQFISNVPAALLLSEFAESINNLIVGVNLGGLGTLIASMASLISFKLLAHTHNDLKGKYFVRFTITNVIYLLFLLGLSLLLH